MFLQQFVHLAAERNVPAACPLEIRLARFRRDHLQGFKENFPFRHDAKGFNHEWTTMNTNCWGQSESSHWNSISMIVTAEEPVVLSVQNEFGARSYGGRAACPPKRLR